MRKPDGLVIVRPGEEAAVLAPLPVRRLWGVGPKMEEALAKLGVVTIGDLAALDPARLERQLGTHGFDLQRLARGEDERDVLAEGTEAKSLGQDQAPGGGNTHFRVAAQLFTEVHRGKKVRLLGIYASHFGEAPPQLGLFDE